MKCALEISPPKIDKLMPHIGIRHDIIHRGGKTKEGKSIDVTEEALEDLRAEVQSFVDNIEEELLNQLHLQIIQ